MRRAQRQYLYFCTSTASKLGVPVSNQRIARLQHRQPRVLIQLPQIAELQDVSVFVLLYQ
jgi:hypothetical protein